MHEHHSFSFLSQIPGLEHAPLHVIHAILIAVVLMATMTVARAQLAFAQKKAGGALIPPEKLTYRNFFEIIAEKLYGLVDSVMGHHNAKVYYPFIATLFTFIFASNILGLIPGFGTPTDNMNTTLALGVFVFIYYNIIGIKENGVWGHLKHFMMLDVLPGPLMLLVPLIFVIEILSHMIRPVSLSLRLKWNMTGDHIVLGVFSDIAPYIVPTAFMGLGMFVAFIQAFVFCLLTMVYISMSTAHDH